MSATTPLRLGTRASALARTQSEQVAGVLRTALGRPVELVDVSTHGDASRAPLDQIGGTGVFVSALREAVLDGRVDLAVHSLKDLPTAAADGIALAAVPRREDPRDALVTADGRTLGELPPGSRVGTGSPRRVAQLAALGLGLALVGIRGNVDTRIAHVTSGELDGVVLARAGLARLGRTAEITETLDPIQVLPAPGQGALAVECRADDADLLAAVAAAIDDPATRTCVSAERALLAELEAGCTAPVGALAELAEADGDTGGEELWLRAVALSTDGGLSVRRSLTGPATSADELGRKLAAGMLADGAGALLGPESSAPPDQQAPSPAVQHHPETRRSS